MSKIKDPEELTRRRHDELTECFAVLDSSLASYYAGNTHMYRPMAGQLRILLCDREPLLQRAFPNLSVAAIRPIDWSIPTDVEIFEGAGVRIGLEHPPEHEYRLATMPFLITRYRNGLQVADLQFAEGGASLELNGWIDQRVIVYPSEISLRDIVRSVADKGGGAHVDDVPNDTLIDLHRTGPAAVGMHVLFIVALARMAQRFGLQYVQFRGQFGYLGRLEDVRFDPEHPSVHRHAQPAPDLVTGERQQYMLTVLKRIK